MTEITLRLYPLPEAISAATCSFPSVDAAVRTTIEVIQMGIPIARCELLDANAVRAVNRHDKLTLREAPMLLMEFHGTEASVAEQAASVQEIAPITAAKDSSGPRHPRRARVSGRRVTTPTSPRCRPSPAAAA